MRTTSFKSFMNVKSRKRSPASQELWDAFKSCVEDNRVRADRSPFYVKWAQVFVDFLPRKRLRERARQEIDSFLADLDKRCGIEDW